MLALFARLGGALAPHPVGLVDAGAMLFVSDVLDAQGGHRAGGVCGRGYGLPLGERKGAVHADQL